MGSSMAAWFGYEKGIWVRVCHGLGSINPFPFSAIKIAHRQADEILCSLFLAESFLLNGYFSFVLYFSEVVIQFLPPGRIPTPDSAILLPMLHCSHTSPSALPIKKSKFSDHASHDFLFWIMRAHLVIEFLHESGLVGNTWIGSVRSDFSFLLYLVT